MDKQCANYFCYLLYRTKKKLKRSHCVKGVISKGIHIRDQLSIRSYEVFIKHLFRTTKQGGNYFSLALVPNKMDKVFHYVDSVISNQRHIKVNFH